jgi:hypothetical protein
VSARRRMDREQFDRLSMAEQHEWFRSTQSRRSVLRGGLVGAGAALAAPVMLAGTAQAETQAPAGGLSWWSPGHAMGSAATLASPFGRHLAFGARPDRQVTVSWQVPLAVKNPFVRIGTSPFDFGNRVAAEVRALTTPALGSAPALTQYYLHAHLDGLRPDTDYLYTVGHDGFDARVPDRIATFRTAPRRGTPSDPFTFTAFGDQGASANAIGNNAVILAQNPAFHLHAGDISYADSSGAGLPADTFDPRVWDQFFVQTEQVAAHVPWMAAVGNHDMESVYSPNGYGGDVGRFTFPGNGPSVCPATYSFIHGNVAVISLDANDVSYEIPANLGYSGGQQTSWLEERLKFLRAQPDVDFIVVFFHHCAFSTCSAHASEGGVRQKWVPLFDTYKVDLVVNGHNHIFERTDPIIGGQPTKVAPTGSTIEPARDGTTYVTVGAAGRSLYSFPVADSYAGNDHDLDSVPTFEFIEGGAKQNETVTWSRRRFTGYSFLAVDSTPARFGRATTLKLRVISEYGQELDNVTLTRTAGIVDRPTRGVDAAAPDVEAG